MKRKMYVFFITLVVVIAGAGPLAAQSAGTPNLQLAHSNSDYPVTPGDVYSIAYVNSLMGYGSDGSMKTTSFELMVGTDCSVDMPLFGSFDLSGMTFAQAKTVIRKAIENILPGSNPQVVISAVGIFQVSVQGEVTVPGYYSAWGLTRLSDIWAEVHTDYSSLRQVVLIRGGETMIHDIYMARKNLYADMDPYLRSGDRIIVKRHPLIVNVDGEVYHPGVYQLQEGETLKDLVETYAEGMTPMADFSRVLVRRLSGGSALESDFSVIDVSVDEYPEFGMKNGDMVVVRGIKDTLPSVTFEGALNLPDSGANGSGTVAARFQYTFTPGETLLNASLAVKDKFNTVSDLENAYIIRGVEGTSQFIDVNIYKLLYAYNPADDIELEPGDRIVIPLKEFYVSIEGGVVRPGRYPYIPGKTADEYILTAGGRSPQNNGSGVRIKDFGGEKKDDDAYLMPDDQIYVPKNSFAHVFGTYITPIATITALTVAVIDLIIKVYTLSDRVGD